MSSHVSDTGGLCCRTGSRYSGGRRHCVRGTTSDKAPANLFGGTELATCKCACPSDRISWAVIMRSLSFEQAHDVIGAVRRPRRNHATIGFAQSL
jgi:hypothetical protein